MDKEDIEEFITENLHELAWRNDYALNERTGTWCFLNAMREAGFMVDMKREPYRLFDTFHHNGIIWEMDASLSIQDIAVGWKQAPRSSPQSFYNSMYKVIDTMQEQVKRSFPEVPGLRGFYRVPNDISNAMCKERSAKAHKALKFMEKHFLEYFQRYQEDFLTGLEEISQDISPPKILNELFRQDIIDLEKINEALVKWREAESGLSATDRTIAFLKHGMPLQDPEIISESDIWGYIWGNYLLKLANIKGYKFREYNISDTEYGILEKACDIGWQILERNRV
jgi:hypothetical protein